MQAMNDKTLQPPLKQAQSSIRSFFKPKSPNYASPPPAPGSLRSSPAAAIIAPLPASDETPLSSDTNLHLAPHHSETPDTKPPPAPHTTVSTSPLPSQASISKILPSHIQALKRINALLLCITYPDTFYTTILHPNPPPTYSRAILWATSPSSSTPPTLVGGLVCRLEASPTADSTSALYIQSLALLSPYRNHGLATATLNDVISSIIRRPQPATPITSLYAHVWTENTDGLEWYAKRGFVVEGDVVRGYYRRLTPDTAWVVRRTLGASDHLRHAASPPAGTSTANEAPPSLVVTPTTTNTSTSAPPLPQLSPGPAPPRGNSYQTTRPDTEWNDLPSDILLPSRTGTPGGAGGRNGSGPGSSGVDSGRSSRSSSAAAPGGGRRKRQYPAAAFAGGGGGV